MMAGECTPSELGEVMSMSPEDVEGLEYFCEHVNRPCFFGIAKKLDCADEGCRFVQHLNQVNEHLTIR